MYTSKKLSVLFSFVMLYRQRVFRTFVISMSFFFQAEDGIRDRSPSRGLGDVYKRQNNRLVTGHGMIGMIGIPKEYGRYMHQYTYSMHNGIS